MSCALLLQFLYPLVVPINIQARANSKPEVCYCVYYQQFHFHSILGLALGVLGPCACIYFRASIISRFDYSIRVFPLQVYVLLK